VLKPIFECGTECWDRYFSVERCVRTDNFLWSGVSGPIFKCGSVCWYRYLNVERFVGTDI